MAQITFQVPTNADAVWWMELGRKLGTQMEVVFDPGLCDNHGKHHRSAVQYSQAHYNTKPPQGNSATEKPYRLVQGKNSKNRK